jgi:hypothetical protein
MPISSPLRQARRARLPDGWADGYQEAMEQFCSKRRLMGEAALRRWWPCWPSPAAGQPLGAF